MIITTGEKWLTVCVIYDVFICVTCRNKHPILLAKQSLVSFKVGEQCDKLLPVSFIEAIFWDGQIEGSLTSLKTQPRPSASLSLSLVPSAASVATMLSSSPPSVLQLQKIEQVFKLACDTTDRMLAFASTG